MSITFNIKSMLADFSGFARAASKYLENDGRLQELERLLTSAVAAAKRSGEQIVWSTGRGEDVPIKTRASRSYRSGNGNQPNAARRALFAEVSFRFQGTLSDDQEQINVSAGGTEVKLRWEGGEDCAMFHFDIHPQQNGHPTLHVQFASKVAEVPRLLSFYAHPLDVLEFVLMELFQGDWRKARTGTKLRADLQHYSPLQRNRIVALMAQYSDWLSKDERDAPLLSLQSQFAPPFNLHPAAT